MKPASDFTSASAAEYKPITVNGVEVTIFKRWTIALVNREAGGESIPYQSQMAWREVLGYDKDVSAKVVADSIRRVA